MSVFRHIPNFITCLNLFCGCLGIIQVFSGKMEVASELIFLACILDFLDGFAARLLKTHSLIGKELDSLADIVTFGVLPGIILFKLSTKEFSIDSSNVQDINNITWYYYLTLIVPVFSALRLAKFNIDTRQTDSFIGVPVPANAMLIASLPFILNNGVYKQYPDYLRFGPIAVGIIMSLLLVSEIPLIALKFKSFSWKENKSRYVLILFSIGLFITFKVISIPLIILSYILFSLFEKNFSDKKLYR